MTELWTPGRELLTPDLSNMSPAERAEWDKYAERVPTVAKKLARPHIEAPGSILVEYDEDPDDPMSSLGKAPDVFYVAGNPLPTEVVDQAAEKIAPGYMGARERMFADERSSAIFDQAYELLDSGESVVINTLHVRDLRDIAVAQKAADGFLLAKHQQRLGEGPDYQERSWQTLISVNKAMAWAGVFLEGQKVGVIPTVSILDNHILLPWPITESSQAERGKLPESALRWNNRSVRRLANILMGREAPDDLDDKVVPPQLAAIALTGTTRLATEEGGKSKVSTLSDASIGLVVGSYALPMTAILNRPEPIIHPCAEPVLIERPEQMDELMQLQVEDHNRHEPEVNLVYEAPEHRRPNGA